MHGFFARLRQGHHHHNHHHCDHFSPEDVARAHFWHAHAGRHRPGHGFGPGRFGAPGEPGMEGFGIGRKLRSADLQLLILALLGEQPYHGYELIKAIDERSRGYYVPSPGMIYPALSYLEEVGHAKVDAEGTKKRYSLTAEGEAYLAQNRAKAEALFEQLSRFGERMERARQAWSGEASADDEAEPMGFFGRGGRHRFTSELHDAFHALRDALRAAVSGDDEEQRRAAEILNRAAEEIAGSVGKKSR